jgi:Sulfotransferase family
VLGLFGCSYYSNIIQIGWGGEDDDLWHRMRLNGLLMHPQPDPKLFPQPVRPTKPGEGYFRTISQAQEHHSQQRDHDNKKIIQKMLEVMWRGSDRWQTEGWNDVYYMLTEDINVTELSTEPMDMPEWKDRPLYIPKPKGNATALWLNATANSNNNNNNNNNNNTTAPSNYSSFAALYRNSKFSGATVRTTVRTSTHPIKPAINDHVDSAQATDANNNNNNNNMQEEVDAPYSKPLGKGIDKLVHIKAVAMRGRNQLALADSQLATDEPSAPILELVDIPYTGADILTRAAARSNIAWGQCHWHVKDDCSLASNSGDFRHRFTLEASYAQAQFPWHMPHSPWQQADPLDGAVRFTVVQHPYARALDFFRTWYDKQHLRDKLAFNISDTEYIQQREQPHQVNSFLQKYLNQTYAPWSAPTWMRGVMDMMPVYSVFTSYKSSSYISRTLKYEDLENEWRDLAIQYNYTSTGIDEQIRQLLKEKKDRESQETAWLQPNQFEPKTIDLLNSIYANDFKVFLDYKRLPGTNKVGLDYTHPRTKKHQPAVVDQQLEMVSIPYNGAVGSLTRAAARAGVVWGACHFDEFEKWECPAKKSGDFHDALKVTMNGVTAFQAPWYVELKLWAKNPFSDPTNVEMRLAKTFTVVRHPYERAIAFYRHMYDREHGYYDGFLPMQDEDAWLDPASFEMNDYLQQREDADRMNKWLQNYFSTMHHAHRPLGMELIPQHRYTYRVQHILKYEALTSGLQKFFGQYPAQGKLIDVEIFQEYETKRVNYSKAMKMHRGPKMLERNDPSSLTVAMVNEIYLSSGQNLAR